MSVLAWLLNSEPPEVGSFSDLGGTDTILLLLGVGQLLFRALCWVAIVVIFYDHRLEQRREAAMMVVGGIVLSYLLDLPNLVLTAAGFIEVASKMKW